MRNMTMKHGWIKYLLIRNIEHGSFLLLLLFTLYFLIICCILPVINGIEHQC